MNANDKKQFDSFSITYRLQVIYSNTAASILSYLVRVNEKNSHMQSGYIYKGLHYKVPVPVCSLRYIAKFVSVCFTTEQS
jgi:hypothetical protein